MGGFITARVSRPRNVVRLATANADIPGITRDMCSCAIKCPSSWSVYTVIAVSRVKRVLNLETSESTRRSANNTTWVHTEKLVEDLVTIQDNCVVVHVDVLPCKVGTLSIKNSLTGSRADSSALSWQILPWRKSGHCTGHGLAGKTKCNSHQRWYRLDSRRSQSRWRRQVLDRGGCLWYNGYRDWHPLCNARRLCRRWYESLTRATGVFCSLPRSLPAKPFLVGSLVGPCYTSGCLELPLQRIQTFLVGLRSRLCLRACSRSCGW